MPNHSLPITVIISILVATPMILVPSPTVAAPTADEILAGADARIEKHRKADATVRVVDAAGKPVPKATLQIQQTEHAFLFGCNIFRWGELDDPKLEAAYRDRFRELFNFATQGFYWPVYEPGQGHVAHEKTEKVARWCKQHGIATKGHPLAWNYRDPSWLPDDPDEIYRLQLARIDDCVKRFTGLIDRWDVVNEVTHFERAEFKRRAPKHTGMWEKVGRMEFTRACFEAARKANPKATLLINDYRVDPKYADTVIKQLVDKNGKPLYDEIGLQSHMHGGAWSTEKAWEVCERFAPFGVPLHFTELTILSGKLGWNGPGDGSWVSTPEGEAYQAREAVRIYKILFSHPSVEAITWWDFSDNRSWKRAPAGLIRKDMTPKPAYVALRKLIRDKWLTTKTLKTDAEGKASFRGFLGNYRVTATINGKRQTPQDFVLKKDAENRWKLVVKPR